MTLSSARGRDASSDSVRRRSSSSCRCYRHLRQHLYPEFMQGAIAAGNRITAEAGASVLAEGGNAIDACIVAAFSAAVAEGPSDRSDGRRLPARLGRRRGDRARLLLRRTVAAARRDGGDRDRLRRRSTQIFHVGEGSVAVPGLVAGLEEAHRRFGSIPWPELVEPAIELARAGLDATDAQRFLHPILAGILERDEGGRRIYGVLGTDRDRTSSSRRSSASATPARRPSAELLPELAERPRALHGRHARAAAHHDRRARTVLDDARRRRAAARSSPQRSSGSRSPRRSTTERRRSATATQSAPPLTVAGTTHISVHRRRRQRRRALLDAGLRLGDLSRRHAAEQHARRARRHRRRRRRCRARGCRA